MATAANFEARNQLVYIILQGSKLQIAKRILGIDSDEAFARMSKEIFDHQQKHNAVYAEFVQRIGRKLTDDTSFPPFLPIELFKQHRVSTQPTEDVTFRSSGTTGQQRSQHPVYDSKLYKTLSQQAFERLYGPLTDWVVLALLPSYLEIGDSSLVFMVDAFIRASNREESRFLLHQPEVLKTTLEKLRQQSQKTLLIGVSYALLDFAEQLSIDFPELIVMETGGMKGRRQELTREELHSALRRGFPDSSIHSEYGMTELLSQAYSQDGTWFQPSPWMRACATEISDPDHILPPCARGLLSFTDLANVHSCAFIQTRDIGIVDERGCFTVEGRMDTSDLRGCNLLYT